MRLLPLLPLLAAGCPEPPPPCDTHDDCAEDAFCADASFCLGAFDRTYAVTLIGATVPPTGTTGGPWDIDDQSDPDLLAFYGVPPTVDANNAIVEEGDIAFTSTIFDTTEATWNESEEITLESGRGFAIEVYDEEPGPEFSFVGGWLWESDAQVVELVRGLSEDQEVTSGSFSVRFRFDPP